MENASKALIIAGAILISIPLISVGIYIYNSTIGVNKNANETGGILSSKANSVTKEIDNVLNENLVRITDHNAIIDGQPYSFYFPKNPKLILEPNTQYILFFDYKVNSKDEGLELGCGVGYGETIYNVDLVYYKKYPNQSEGTMRVDVKTKEKFEHTKDGQTTEVEKPYLQIRFISLNDKNGTRQNGNANVSISNVKFVKVK